MHEVSVSRPVFRRQRTLTSHPTDLRTHKNVSVPEDCAIRSKGAGTSRTQCCDTSDLGSLAVSAQTRHHHSVLKYPSYGNWKQAANEFVRLFVAQLPFLDL